MKRLLAALVPEGVVTATLAVPAEPAGVTAVIVESLTTVIFVAEEPPMVTASAPVNPDPLMVTESPPNVVPSVGLIDVTDGGEEAAAGLATTSVSSIINAANALKSVGFPPRARALRPACRTATRAAEFRPTAPKCAIEPPL